MIVTDILSRTVFKLSQKENGRLAFLSPLWGLGATYDVHRGLIGKRVMDFPLALIKLFSLSVTAEALRANID